MDKKVIFEFSSLQRPTRFAQKTPPPAQPNPTAEILQKPSPKSTKATVFPMKFLAPLALPVCLSLYFLFFFSSFLLVPLQFRFSSTPSLFGTVGSSSSATSAPSPFKKIPQLRPYSI